MSGYQLFNTIERAVITKSNKVQKNRENNKKEELNIVKENESEKEDSEDKFVS